ncbi:MAG TPA: hypothetical protein VIX12_08835 [Candidatus Binataceae bacterium]
MGREPKVALIGATGAVGHQLIDLIAARSFAQSGLRLFSSETGSPTTLTIGETDYLVEQYGSPSGLAGFDVVFLALTCSHAADIIRAAPGPILIDLSAATEPPTQVPMVSPGLTSRERIVELKGKRLFAIPHPVAHVLASCIRTLDIKSGFVASIAMLGASAGGREQVAEVVKQSVDLLNARLSLDDEETQVGFNAIVDDRDRSLARAIAAQTAALVEHPIQISVSAISIPVLHGSALSIQIPGGPELAASTERLRAAPGILIAEDAEPLGVIDAVGQEAIIVKPESDAGALSLWCMFDNARLAALLALWVAETFGPASSSLD